MVKTDPLVSVCILTWNRKETVLENLRHLLKQSYHRFEIILVDNGSIDHTVEAVRNEFSDVHLIPIDRNIGIAGRNEAIKAANGDIIITLDDDVFFHSDYEIEKIVHYLERHSDVNVGIMKILDENGNLLEMNWYHPRRWESFSDLEFETDYIPEGASFFRKNVFRQAGYYPESFFIGQEGPDLAYRIINQGFKIMYTPGIHVIHRCETSGKTKKRFVYNNMVNHFRLAVRNFPSTHALFYMIYRLFSMFPYSVQQKNLYWYFCGVRDAFHFAQKELKNRQPITKMALKRLKEIRKMKPNAAVKLYYQIRRQRERSRIYKMFSE